ncbi:myocardin related transcription factor Ab isoform X2 [Stigmatopora nigra]
MEVTGAGVWNQSPQSEAVTSELQELSLQADPDELRLQDRKNVLQLKLQQRRTREELVSQGIMPPLKSPAAFHEQRRSLERARTEDYLKRKIRSRPERSELVRMHILEETSAEPSLQAKQLQLKRARLADDLNDKISHRPGPIELVHKNILSVCPDQPSSPDSPKGAGGECSSLDEDSSGDPLSPDLLTNHDSPLSVAPQPSPSDGLSPNGDVSPIQFVAQVAPPPPPPTPVLNGSGSPPPPKVTNGIVLTSRTSCTPFGQLKSHSKTSSERPPLRSKKAKDNKPKVKKLKYHQYIPPDQKADKERPPLMDSSYAKLLQQQQLFLQLQILNQQQQHYNYHAILPAPPKPATETPLPTNPSPSPTRNIPTSNAAPPTGGNARQAPPPVGGAKPTTLPANLDELKVAELKQELKLRGLTVSGTKNDLIERLRNYQEQNGGPTAAISKNATPQLIHPSAISTEGGLKSPPTPALPARVARFGSTGSSPPVSPSPSERSLAGLSPDETSCNGDTFGEMVSSPLTQLTLHPSPGHPSSVSPNRAKDEGFHGSSPGPANPSEPFSTADKDQMLQEKDKQIEELTRMLRQKQRLVETLRSQLELGKTAPSEGAPKVDGLLKVKEEVGEEAMAGVVEEAQSKRVLQPTQCSQETLLKLQQIKRLQVQQGPTSEPPKEAERKNDDAQILLRQQRQLQQLIIQQTRQKQLQAQQHRLSQAQGKRNPTSHKTPLQIKQLRVQVRNQAAADQGHQRKQLKTQKRQQQRQPTTGNVAGVTLGTLGAQQVAPLFINQQNTPQIPTQAISLDLLKAGGTLVTDANGNHYLIALAANAADGAKRAPSQVKSANGRVTLQRLQSTPSEMPGADGQSQAGKISQSVSQPIQKKAELDLDTNRVPAVAAPAVPSCATAPANMQQPFFDDMSSDSESQSNPGSSFKRAQACPSYDRHTLFTPPSPKPNTFLPTQRSKGNGVNYQQMDDLFDILLKSGEISGFKANPDPSLAPLHSELPSPASPLHLSPPTPPSPLISAAIPPRDGRLDDFLEAGGLGLMDGLHGQMLGGGGGGGPLDHHSPSPMDTSDLGFSPHSTGLDFGDGALDSMDWLDISMVGGTGEGEGSGVLTPLAPHTPPSVFSADFLDGTDLQLHLESCL